MKLFMVVYLILFYGLAFFWRSYVTWRATGINPYRLTQTDDLAGFLARLYRLVSAGIVAAVLAYSLGPAGWHDHLGPLAWMNRPAVTVTGVILLMLALVWVLIAQAQMGASWRIGIDEENETVLVTDGVFRFSRNPIFLGMRANLLGLFLVMPNALTLALWLLGDVAIQMQVFLEEVHLHQQHGAAYQQYRDATPRYLGIPDRLTRQASRQSRG